MIPELTVPRSLFIGGLASVIAASLTTSSSAMPLRRETTEGQGYGRARATPRYLWLKRLDSGEEVRSIITLDDRHLFWPGYRSLCWMLRDAHVLPNRGYREISVLTLKVLWETQYLALAAGVNSPIIIHSAFRSMETNARTEGAVRNSYHLYGMAVDFHVPGIPIQDLHRVVRERPDAGGVGKYDRGGSDGWIHLDTGWKRDWNG